MKLVQTTIPDEEHQMLRHRAEKEGKSIKAVAREAIRAHLLPDRVNPEDPIFQLGPLIRKRRGDKTTWYSRDHDDLLYPRSP